MQETGIEVLAVYGDREHHASLNYLTGFDPRFEEALRHWIAAGEIDAAVVGLQELATGPGRLDGHLYEIAELAGYPFALPGGYIYITRGMLAYKLEPGHLHLQLPGLVRVSRTVQWFREAAGEEARSAESPSEPHHGLSAAAGPPTTERPTNSPSASIQASFIAKLLRGRRRAGESGAGVLQKTGSASRGILLRRGVLRGGCV